MAYRIEAIPMTLSYTQCLLPTASLFKCEFSYSCAAVENIFLNIARRAVPLR